MFRPSHLLDLLIPCRPPLTVRPFLDVSRPFRPLQIILTLLDVKLHHLVPFDLFRHFRVQYLDHFDPLDPFRLFQTFRPSDRLTFTIFQTFDLYTFPTRLFRPFIQYILPLICHTKQVLARVCNVWLFFVVYYIYMQLWNLSPSC